MVYVTFKAIAISAHGFHASKAARLLTATVKASVTVRYEIPFITWFQNIHDGMVYYSVGIEWQDIDNSFFRFENRLAMIF